MHTLMLHSPTAATCPACKATSAFHFPIRLTRRRNAGLALMVAHALLLGGCASTPGPSVPGAVAVRYTTELPYGSTLKRSPTEVQLVERADTHKEVGKQIGINLFMLAMGGVGFSAQGFSKTSLAGNPIAASGDRANLRNPIPEEFVARLSERINATVKADPALAMRHWRQPVNVAGGFTRLLYDELDGDTPERLHLAMDLTVYKRREDWSPLSFSNSSVLVDCNSKSPTARAQEDWAPDDYREVRLEFDALLDACERKVMAALPDLLKD